MKKRKMTDVPKPTTKGFTYESLQALEKYAEDLYDIYIITKEPTKEEQMMVQRAFFDVHDMAIAVAKGIASKASRYVSRILQVHR